MLQQQALHFINLWAEWRKTNAALRLDTTDKTITADGNDEQPNGTDIVPMRLPMLRHMRKRHALSDRF